MATHSSAAARGPDPYGTAVTYRSQPSSPTLTNPDMILPDYDDADSVDSRSQSPLLMWTKAVDLRSFAQGAFHHHHLEAVAAAAAAADDDDDDDDDPMSSLAPLGPATPIIYGNGTMLSDIGEVTEVESTVGTQSRRGSVLVSVASADATPPRVSPAVAIRRTLKRAAGPHLHRERRLSAESASTLNDVDRRAALADADDAVSVGDSNFQGDDEESMASSYMDDAPRARVARRLPGPGQPLSEQRLSTVSISKRAEQILANAKRRLTTMEGNLNRARTLSYSSVSECSTPSPVGRPATSLRQHLVPRPSSHGRNASEAGFAPPARPSAHVPRSASALGAAGGYRQPLQRPARLARASHRALDAALATLSEDDDGDALAEREARHGGGVGLASPTYSPCSPDGRAVSVAQVRDLHDQMQGLKGKISSLKEQARADSMKRRSLQSLRTPSPFTHARWDQGYSSDRQGATPPDPASPAAAAAAAASLKSAVPGLETDGSGGGGSDDDDDADMKRPRGAVDAHAPDGDGPSVNGYHEARKMQEDAEEPRAAEAAAGEGEDEGEDVEARQDEAEVDEVEIDEVEVDEVEVDEVEVDEVEVDEVEVDEVEVDEVEVDEVEVDEVEEADDVDEAEAPVGDNVSESGESLYHDTFQHPISHEDREDAFDYENFFLHSAMGTMSRQGPVHDDDDGDNYDSDASGDSVETTRGPRPRRASIDTFTTVDSFATAVEGRTSRSPATAAGEMSDGFAPSWHYGGRRGDDDDDDDDDDAATATNSTLDRASASGCSDETGRRLDGRRPRTNSVLHRPVRARGSPSPSLSASPSPSPSPSPGSSNSTGGSTLHRPSVSSFESTGTNRRFPLVNRTRLSGGVLTPGGSPEQSPEQELKQVADSLLTETASLCDADSGHGPGGGGGGGSSPAMQMLSREDQALVEQVVASLGKCVLGLTEATARGAARAELRRRIEAARAVLEEGVGEGSWDEAVDGA